MRDLFLLLAPRYLSLRNTLRRLPWQRAMVFALIALTFWFGTYIFFYRMLTYFRDVPAFGPILTQKILGMTFMTFLSILIFSNLITALSTYFLSQDLHLLISTPIPPARLHAAKFVETLVDSSWMILLFGLPAFLAYGTVHDAGVSFYLVTLFTLVPFLIIPAALGVSVAMILVRFFPARRTKNVLLLVSMLLVGFLYLFLRILQPERLVNPEAFADFVAFLAAMDSPSSPYLPSTWATEVLLPFLGRKTGEPLFYYLTLSSTAAFLLLVSSRAFTALFPISWSKAQESRPGLRPGRSLGERLMALMAAPLPPVLRTIMIKDVKTFFRDPSQWSQLFLLGALIVVYVYNFSVLPTQGAPASFYLQNVVAFFNLALATFVLAAVAARFVFPAVSLEGQALWIIKAAPVSLRRFWWSKFCIGLFPLLILGEVLVIVTNFYLGVTPFMMGLSTVTLFCMTFGIVSLAMALGATYPQFAYENIAKIATGFGGVLYMILCLSFIGMVVMLEAGPVYTLFLSHVRHTPLLPVQWATVMLAFALVLLLNVFVFWYPMRVGMRKLEELEV